MSDSPPPENTAPDKPTPDMTRRAIVASAVTAAGYCAAAIAFSELAGTGRSRFTVSPAKPTPETLVAVPAADLGELKDMPRRCELTLTRQDGWKLGQESATVFAAKRGSEYVVLSAVCPHSGCVVNFD